MIGRWIILRFLSHCVVLKDCIDPSNWVVGWGKYFAQYTDVIVCAFKTIQNAFWFGYLSPFLWWPQRQTRVYVLFVTKQIISLFLNLSCFPVVIAIFKCLGLYSLWLQALWWGSAKEGREAKRDRGGGERRWKRACFRRIPIACPQAAVGSLSITDY